MKDPVTPAKRTEKESGFIRFINGVEKAASKIPHPFFIFTYLAIIVAVLSLIFSGTSVSYMAAAASGGVEEKTIEIVNLLSADYIKGFFKDFVNIYQKYSPLGIVLVLMLGVGLAERVGLFNTFMRKSLLNAKPALVTLVLAFIACNANVASNAGGIIAPTIGAAIFTALGRDPILGCLIGHVGAAGGFTACVIPVDTMVSAVTRSVNEASGINAPANVMFCYYWRFVATFVITACIVFVSERIMPRVLKRPGICADITAPITEDEKRGLRYALIALIVCTVILLAVTVPHNGFLRSADGKLLPDSPLMDSINIILFVYFTAVAVAYGLGARVIKRSKDIPALMGEAIKDTSVFLVIVLPASIFTQMFSDSHIGNVISVKGAEMLESIGLTGIPLALVFAVLVLIINLFMPASTAKWMILAPIFVPMFYRMGFSPALTTAISTIGDGAGNLIAPVANSFPVVIGLLNKYKRPEDPEYGLGTLLSYNMTYFIFIYAALLVQLVVWMLLKLPLGPGVPAFA